MGTATTGIRNDQMPAVRVVRRDLDEPHGGNGKDRRTAPAPARNFTDLTGRVAVVVGGTSGLGRSIALGMAQAGATVVPVGRRQDRIDGICAEIETLGRKTLRQTVDVTQRKSLDALRDKVETAFGASRARRRVE